jgi:outer membrane protein OmpA-like peptidoglycan-associated protein
MRFFISFFPVDIFPFIKRTVLAFIFLFCKNTFSNAQNFFANADFETLNNCTEYHQDCAPEAWFYLKPAVTPLINNSEVPKPFSGKDLLIVQMENVFNKIAKRSFIYSMFCCPLQTGKNYKLSFYVNTNGRTFNGLDFYFSDKEFISENFKPDSIFPTIHISSEDITNELAGWNFVETMYTATGKEKFCYIGNLSKKAFDFSVVERMNKAGDVFYFMDDISFKPLNAEQICPQYQSNVDKLYAQNLRHTEGAIVESNFVTDTIIVPSVFFETDKAIIKPSFKKLLNQLIVKAKEKNILKVEIEGHTDNQGTQEHNIVLSEQRAYAVKDFFIEKIPDLKESITAIGKASSMPIADNNTKIGRAQNRRVQIVFTYNSKK